MEQRYKLFYDKIAIFIFFSTSIFALIISPVYLYNEIKFRFGFYGFYAVIITLIINYFVFFIISLCLYKGKEKNKKESNYYYHTINSNENFNKILSKKYMYALTGGRLYISNVKRKYQSNIKPSELIKIIIVCFNKKINSKYENSKMVSQNVLFFDKELGDKIFDNIYPTKSKGIWGYLELWMLWKHINNEFISKERKDIKFEKEHSNIDNTNVIKIYGIDFIENTNDLYMCKKKLRFIEILLSISLFYFLPISWCIFMYIDDYYTSYSTVPILYCTVNVFFIIFSFLCFIYSFKLKDKCIIIRDKETADNICIPPT